MVNIQELNEFISLTTVYKR